MTDKQREIAARKRVYRKAEILAEFEGMSAQEIIDDLVEEYPHITIGELDLVITKTIDLFTGNLPKEELDMIMQKADEL